MENFILKVFSIPFFYAFIFLGTVQLTRKGIFEPTRCFAHREERGVHLPKMRKRSMIIGPQEDSVIAAGNRSF